MHYLIVGNIDMSIFKDMFRAFKYRNFRLFFPGLAISQIGIWVQNVSINWLVYDISKSSLVMGTVLFVNTIPLMLLTPFAGVIADKFSRHKLLLMVQILFATQAFLMTFLSFMGWLRIWNIMALGVFLNCIAAIDMPLRQSTFVFVVDNKEDLGNAISLNSTCFNLARLVGPSIGGLLIAGVGVSVGFLFNFLCLVPSIILVKKMKIIENKPQTIQQESFFEGLKEGLIYSIKTPQIRTLILYLGLYCFLILVYPMLLPIYTAEVLGKNADTLGFLLGAAGVGSLISSLLLATKHDTKNLRLIVYLGVVLACLCYIGLGFTTNSKIALLLMFGVGLGCTTVLTPENMLLQSIVDNDKRGRVLGMNALAFLGPSALSSLFAGALSHMSGISHTFIILGTLMLICGSILTYKLLKLPFNRKI